MLSICMFPPQIESNAYCIAPSLHHILHYILTASTSTLHHFLTASLPHCITSSLHHSLTASLSCIFPHSITPSLLHCITPYFIPPSLHHYEYNMYAVHYCQPSTTRWAVPLLFLALNESTSVLHSLH